MLQQCDTEISPNVPSLTEEVNTPTEVDILSHAHAQFCVCVRNIASNSHLTYSIIVVLHMSDLHTCSSMF